MNFRLPLRWWIVGTFSCLAAGPLAAVTTDVSLNQLSFATTTFSVDSGLPSNVAQALVQTRDGYLWIGTEGGLARFDGVRFTIFRVAEVPALGDNLIRFLYEDRRGDLWIGTNRGMARYREGKFQRVAGLQAPVAAMAEDSTGSIWVGTQGAGLWELREDRLTQRADGTLMKPTDSPMRVFVDSSDRVWAAIDHGPLLYLDKRVMHVPAGATAGFVQTNRIAESPRGTLWFATRRELFRVRDGEVRQFGRAAGVGEEQLTDLLVDRAGRLWVAGHSLWVAENPEVDEFTKVVVPEVEYPRFLIQDREGTFWLGTSGDGVARMRPSSFRMVTFVEDQPLRRARSVTADTDGALWVALGTDDRGLARIAPDGKITFLPLGDGADGETTAVLGGADGSLWIGTRGALAVRRNDAIERIRTLQNVRMIFEAHDHSVWFGLIGQGAVRYRDGVFTPVDVPEEFRRATPSAMAEGPDGSIYIGYLMHGILQLGPNGTVGIGQKEGLPSDEIRAVHIDRDGNLCVGLRRDGLAIRLDGRWRNPDALIQPFGERVTAIDEDDSGNVWFGSVRGVLWAKREDVLAIARGASPEGKLHVPEGIGVGVVGTGSQPTLCHGPGGTLWFATHDGVLAVRTGTIPTNAIPPPVRIETVGVDGRVSPPTAELSLPAGVRSLTIDYTALSFVQPNRVFFRYRLVGHDRDWVQAGTRRTAFYTRLAPGSYEFRVIACNEDGVWNETGAGLTIVQLPWFYETRWFYALVAAGVIAFGFALYYWRTAGLRRLVARQTEQIRRQVDQEAELRAELERKARLESLGVLAGGIAHDFNNLLTVIIANIGLARIDERVRAAAGTQLAAAERGAERAAELTQQLLTFAKGGDPVRRAVALPDVVREAADFARHGTPVRCDVTVEPNLPPADVDRAQISRVVHNLVLNATQAMPNGGVITIQLSTATVAAGEVPGLSPGCYVKLSMSDTGGGIAAEHLPRIFDPYFSTKPKSHGLGLATVHSIVKKHQGHVTVESQLGCGTTFRLWLPIAKETVKPVAAAAATTPAPGRRLRVLFMDDEEIIRIVAAGILRHLDHEATVVADGSDAVREYGAAHQAGKPFDVVVLDLTVPGGMGGRVALDAMRRIDPDVRAIVSSGYSSDPILANYRQYGFQAVVPKPYQLADLDRAIQQVARPAA